jgi:hypothetical protein
VFLKIQRLNMAKVLLMRHLIPAFGGSTYKAHMDTCNVKESRKAVHFDIVSATVPCVCVRDYLPQQVLNVNETGLFCQINDILLKRRRNIMLQGF